MAVLVNILMTYNGAGNKKAMRDLALLQKQATLSGNTMAAGMFKAAAGMQRAGAQMAKTGALMSKYITLPVVAIGAVSVVMAAKFESSMKLIQTQAGASAKDVEVLSAAVLKLAAKGQHGPNELAAALYHLKSVGMDNVTAMKALTQSERLANVGGADLEQTTNAVAGAYKSGIKGAQTFSDTVGTLNAIIGAGNLRMEDLNSAMGTGFLVNAQQWGVSLTSVGAALATMTSRGIPATRAAMALKMAFAGMGAPSAVAEKAFGALGLKSRDLAVALREKGLGGALSILKDKLKGLSKTDQSIQLTEMFGAKSSQAILTLLGNLDDYDRTQKQVAKNTGKFSELAAAQSKDATAKWDHFKSSMSSAAILIGNQLLPTAIRFADALGGVGAWLNKLSPGTRKWVVTLAAVLAVGGPLLLIVGKMTLGIGKMIGVVAKLSMALSANPFGLIVIAIAALVVGFIVLWKKCAWFRNFWIAVWEKVKVVFAAVWPVIKAVLGFIVAGIQENFRIARAVVLWFWGWAGPFIKTAIAVWWKVVKKVMGFIIGGIKDAWHIVSVAAKKFWDWAGPYIKKNAGVWWTVIKEVFAKIKEVAKVVWPIIVTVVKGAIQNVKTAIHTIQTVIAFVRDVFNRIKNVAKTVGETISKTVGDIWRGIKKTAQTVWDGITGVVKSAWGSIAGFVNKIIGAVNTVVTQVNRLAHTSVGTIPLVPTGASSSTRGNGGAGEEASTGRRVSTPRVMDNEGMGGPLDSIGSALGSAGSWVGDMIGGMGVHWPQPTGGLFGGITGALLEMVKDAVWGFVKQFGGGEGMQIVDFAKSMLGVPYLWGGTSPAGFDCSGLMYWAYAQAGKSIPRVPTNGGRQISRDAIRPADIMFYYPGAMQHGQRVPFGHFKMYAGNNQTIESTTGGVQMRPADWAGAAQIRTYLRLGGGADGPLGGYPVMMHGRESVVAHDNPTRGLEDLVRSGVVSAAQQGDSYVFEGCLFAQDFDTVIAEANQRGSVKIGRRTARTRAKR